MRYLRKNLKTAFILAGLVLLVAVVREFVTIPASSEEVKLVKDGNDFAKASLETGTETGMKPLIDIKANAAGAFGEGGKVAFGWETEKRWPIASLTKLMTALVAFENISPKEVITITEEAIEIEGVSGNFAAGEKFKLNDLVKAMMLVSSNDAAGAISFHFGEDNFLASMNKKALELGMTNTNFVDPTGLSFKNQSTVNDLIRLTDYIRETQPEILAVTRKPKDVITEVRTGKKRTIVNINTFAGRSDFLGGKTGSTPEAGGNLISVFKVAGEPKTIIVLGADDKFAETEKIKDSLWQ